MAPSAQRRRAEKLRLDRALGQVYSDLAHDEARLARFRAIHVAVLQHSTLLRPARRAPALDPVEALENLACFHLNRVRPVDSWRPSGSSPLAVIGSLAQHLYGEHPTPRFFASVWFGGRFPMEQRRREWFVRHSLGRPVRRVVAPLPMTRREESIFLNSPDHLTVPEALRRSQVLALGGTPWLAREVLRTRLVDDTCDETFWTQALRFFVERERELEGHRLEAIVEGLHHLALEPLEVVTESGERLQVQRMPGFSFQGRTVRSLTRLLADRYGDPRSAWQPSGLRETIFEGADPTSGREGETLRWVFTELLDPVRLRAEGVAMGSCVGGYVATCRSRRSSIWSLRPAGDRGLMRSILTVEVDLASRTIVEALGRFNRPPTPHARRLLTRWAQREGLRLCA